MDRNVAFGCGDYPTNECPSERVNYKEDKGREKEMRAKGYLQDSTGCWYDPKAPSVFGTDW